MRLHPKGFVTLNLDKFAGEAMAALNPGKIVTPVYGLELAQKWEVIIDAPQYLVYLHGYLTDPSNWVLTQGALNDLLHSNAHQHFLFSLYSQHLVLFVGLGMDDIALSSRLLELKREGFRPPGLYWLTTRLDQATTKWANAHDVSLINYQAHTNEEHVTILAALADDLRRYLPQDDVAPLPEKRPEIFDTIEAPSDPKALAQLDPETIRNVVSNRLQHVLSNAPQDQIYTRFQEFCRTYRFPLNRAFFKDSDDEFNVWFGYKLNFPSLGRGNFGEVFHAYDKSGIDVAVKVLHENILNDTNMLGGFRRGVRSMRFLSEANIDGVVKIIDAFELPPTIVMDFVPGYTLQDALEAQPKMPWLVKLRIISKVTRIVYSSHCLHMTVMHRDLKPSNIMIRNLEFNTLFDP